MDSARTRLVDQALNKTRLESEMSKNSPLRSISLDRVANRGGFPLFLQILADFFLFPADKVENWRKEYPWPRESRSPTLCDIGALDSWAFSKRSSWTLTVIQILVVIFC